LCGHFYTTRTWLRCAAEATGGEVGAVCVRDGDRIVAATPYWVTTGRENPSRTPATVLADAGVTGSRFVMAGTSTAYWSELLTGAGPVDEAVRLIVQALRDLTRERGADGCLALYAGDQTALAYREAARTMPVLLNVDVRTVLPPTVAEYPVLVSKQRRTRIHREWRTFREAGYELAVESLADCVTEFVPLAAALERKYGNHVDERALRDTLTVQSRRCGEYDRVFTARRDGRLIAACLSYVYRDCLTTRMFGADYDRLSHAAEYFGLVYYEPAEYAIKHGYTSVHTGIASTQAKVTRGGEIQPLWAVDLSATPLWDADRAAEINTRRRTEFEEIAGQNSAMPVPIWPAW
jgi:hypothetical protein